MFQSTTTQFTNQDPNIPRHHHRVVPGAMGPGLWSWRMGAPWPRVLLLLVVTKTDRHGTQYEIRRILGHDTDVYVGGKLRPGVAIRDTIIRKPLYFAQKDLSAAGKDFGQDLVEKLVGDGLAKVRRTIAEGTKAVETAVEDVLSIHSDVEDKEAREDELKDVKFRLEQFDSHGVKDKLEKQVAFNDDTDFCVGAEEQVEAWRSALEAAVDDAKENFAGLAPHASKHNAALFDKVEAKLMEVKATISDAAKIGTSWPPAMWKMRPLRWKAEASTRRLARRKSLISWKAAWKPSSAARRSIRRGERTQPPETELQDHN